MERIILLQFILAILGTVPKANGTIVFGPGTNMSAVMWNSKVQETGQQNNNPAPSNDNLIDETGVDKTVKRRFLKNLLADARTTYLRDDTNAITKESLGNPIGDNNDVRHETDELYDEKNKIQTEKTEKMKRDYDDFLDKYFNDEANLHFSEHPTDPEKDKSILRTDAIIQARKEQRKLHLQAKKDAKAAAIKVARENAHTRLMQAQHDARVAEVIDFIKNNRLSTHYLHEEVRRIKKGGTPRDVLRQMVEYLEVPGNRRLQAAVIDCFKKRRLIDVREKGFWSGRVPNKLILDIVKDPFNDGV